MAKRPNALNLFAKLRRLSNWRLEHEDGAWWRCTIREWGIEAVGRGETATEAIKAALLRHEACIRAIRKPAEQIQK